MNELEQQIAELEEQERNLDTLIANTTDDADVRELTDRRNIITNRLNEKREELRRLKEEQKQRAEQIEEKVYAEDIPFAVVGVDLVGIPAEVIKFVESVVMADRRRIYNEHAIELEQLETEARSNGRTIEELRTIIEQGSADNKRLIYENGNLRDHAATLNSEIRDLRNKLDNAVAQIEEKDTEIERLKSEIEDYQRAKVWGERQAQNVIDVTPEENQSIVAAAEAVKKLYTRTEDYGSIIKVTLPDGSFTLAKRAEVEKEWAPIEVPEVSDFQGDNSGDSETEHGENTATTGTDVGDAPESFEAEVRRRLEKLEYEVFGPFYKDRQVA